MLALIVSNNWQTAFCMRRPRSTGLSAIPLAVVPVEVVQGRERIQQVVFAVQPEAGMDLIDRGRGVVAWVECEAAGQHVQDDAVAFVSVRQRLAVEDQPFARVPLQRFMQQSRLAAAGVTRDADDATLSLEHLLTGIVD